MRALKTTFLFLPRGVQMTMSWEGEAEFLTARNFLSGLTGGLLDTSREVDFCILENDDQYEAMSAYRQELRQAKQR